MRWKHTWWTSFWRNASNMNSLSRLRNFRQLLTLVNNISVLQILTQTLNQLWNNSRTFRLLQKCMIGIRKFIQFKSVKFQHPIYKLVETWSQGFREFLIPKFK
jgi:hypothetical protein